MGSAAEPPALAATRLGGPQGQSACAEGEGGSLGRAAGGQGGTREYLEENAAESARREEKMHLKKLHALRRGGVSEKCCVQIQVADFGL